MKLKITILSFLFITLIATSQSGTSQFKQIDSLFIEWNTPNHPGGVIGVMQNGEIIFSKAYGLASMEYLVPNSTGTIFNTGSVSKQFTAMGIIRLHQQGKLSFDDDIRKYITELPNFGETITIRHLLHHTSGLRSFHAVLGLAGWRGDDARTNEDINRFMSKQQDLNFKPGDEYLYCNTGYMFMVNIIEKVTDTEFKDWMKQEIFEPLGMINTYVEDNYSRITANNATSYYARKINTFERAVAYWGYIGSGNMHSTSADLLKWLSNFYNPKAGWENSFTLIQTLDKLNNGEKNNYAFGVSLDEVNGHKRIQHGGAIGGFRSYVSVFPKEKLSIAVLTNFSSSGIGQKSKKIAQIILEDNTKVAKAIKKPKPIKLSNQQLKKYEASYWNDNKNYIRRIYLKNDTLRYYRSEKSEDTIIPIGKNEFQLLTNTADVRLTFNLTNTQKVMLVSVDGDKPEILTSFDPIKPSQKELEDYTGVFYSPELETSYTIFMEDEKLKWHHPRHGDFDIKILKKDVLEGKWPLATIKYIRNKNNKITGIRVSNGRVKHAWFKKLDSKFKI